MAFVSAEVKPDAEPDVGALAGFDHPAGVVPRERHRLLDEDVLARLRGANRLLGVQRVGRRDVDDIHGGVAEHGVEVVVGAGGAVLLGERFGAAQVAADGGGERRAACGVDRGGHLGVRVAPRTDDSPAGGHHAWPSM